MLKIDGPGRRKTPMLAELEKLDANESPALDALQTKVFRQAVGVLLYVAQDYVECQYVT